jgi:hypothetical protein
MEDYSKGRRGERNYAGYLEKVRGPIRGASLLWREACCARSRLRQELAQFLTQRLGGCSCCGLELGGERTILCLFANVPIPN